MSSKYEPSCRYCSTRLERPYDSAVSMRTGKPSGYPVRCGGGARARARAQVREQQQQRGAAAGAGWRCARALYGGQRRRHSAGMWKADGGRGEAVRAAAERRRHVKRMRKQLAEWRWQALQDRSEAGSKGGRGKGGKGLGPRPAQAGRRTREGRRGRPARWGGRTPTR